MKIRRVHVVIPAHNEQDTIGRCLDAVWLAATGISVPVSVTVVADACGDRTVELCRGRAEVVEVAARNVGRARAAGFADVLTRTGPAPEALWLATTDADSRVHPRWLGTQIALAELGVDVVAGTVEPDGWSGWDPRTPELYARGYVAADGHRHVHGANLGFSAAIYQELGGFRPLATGEDVDLVRRARLRHRTVAWEGSHPVTTSTRRRGRAPGGFAAHLRTVEAGALEPGPDAAVSAGF